MFKPSWLAVPTMALAAAPIFWARSSTGGDLPPGDMEAKARTACAECHDARIIVQQRLTKAAWSKEVDKMIKWGALVDIKDRDALIEYLSIHFPPDQPAYVAPRVSAAKKPQQSATDVW
jgi:hypothetical protein